MAQTAEISREATLSGVRTRSSGGGTSYGLLMHLWSTHRPETVPDVISSLPIGGTRPRRALRILIDDWLVREQLASGPAICAIAESACTRSRVAQILRRAIHEGQMRRTRTPAWRTRGEAT